MRIYLCGLCNDDADGRTFVRWHHYAPTRVNRIISALIFVFGGGSRVHLCRACAPKHLDVACNALRTPSNPRRTHVRMKYNTIVTKE